MKFSLKTFVALVIFFGVVAGFISRRIRVSRPLSVSMTYDVINAKDRISDNYPPPTEMIMWREPGLYRRLRKQAVSEQPPSKEELLRGFLADPPTYTWYEEKHQQIVRDNRDAVLSGTERWLKPSSANLLNVALMRSIHDDRVGFDLLKKKMIGDVESGPTFLFGTFPDEWWHDDLELRDALLRMLKIDEIEKDSIVLALRSMGEKQPWLSHHLAAAKAEESYRRLSAIRSLTEEELSERTFELLQTEISDESAGHRQDELAELLARFFQADDPQLRDKALSLCKRLSRPDEEVESYEGNSLYTRGQNNYFYQQVCLHGGKEFSDYFVQNAKAKRLDCAMKALAKLWPRQKAAEFAKKHKYDAVVVELLDREALPWLRQRLRDEPSLHLARLIAEAAGDEPDPESVAVLESLLPKTEDFAYDPQYFAGRKLLYVMEKLGSQNVEELRAKLPEPNPVVLASQTSNHWIAHDIDQRQLVTFLNDSKVGKKITVDDVYGQIKKNGRPVEEFDHNDLLAMGKWTEGYSAREFTFNALEAAGVARECCQMEWGYLNELLEMVNKVSVGVPATSAKAAKDHRIWLAPECTPPKLHVTFGRRTFELNIFEDQMHPILIAESLNNMLDQFTEYEHRFYAYIVYIDGWDEHCVAYLKPEIAAKLETDFGLIPFPPY